MTMKYVKVKDSEELVRDTSSSAILNTDVSALQAYKEKRRRETNLTRVMEEHELMKQDLQEIKSLLKQIVGQMR
jgi:hypothetical protein